MLVDCASVFQGHGRSRDFGIVRRRRGEGRGLSSDQSKVKVFSRGVASESRALLVFRFTVFTGAVCASRTCALPGLSSCAYLATVIDGVLPEGMLPPSAYMP